jgi:hypothetical protein
VPQTGLSADKTASQAVEVTGLEPATSTMRTSPEASKTEGPEQAVDGKSRWKRRFPSSILTASDPDLPGVPVATGTQRARTCFQRSRADCGGRVRRGPEPAA